MNKIVIFVPAMKPIRFACHEWLRKLIKTVEHNVQFEDCVLNDQGAWFVMCNHAKEFVEFMYQLLNEINANGYSPCEISTNLTQATIRANRQYTRKEIVEHFAVDIVHDMCHNQFDQELLDCALNVLNSDSKFVPSFICKPGEDPDKSETNPVAAMMELDKNNAEQHIPDKNSNTCCPELDAVYQGLSLFAAIGVCTMLSPDCDLDSTYPKDATQLAQQGRDSIQCFSGNKLYQPSKTSIHIAGVGHLITKLCHDPTWGEMMRHDFSLIMDAKQRIVDKELRYLSTIAQEIADYRKLSE